MNAVLVRYRVKADRVAENRALVQAVYDELAAIETDFRYVTFQVDDGQGFVHVGIGDDPPLPRLAAFQAFRSGLEERCVEPPEFVSDVVGLN